MESRRRAALVVGTVDGSDGDVDDLALRCRVDVVCAVCDGVFGVFFEILSAETQREIGRLRRARICIARLQAEDGDFCDVSLPDGKGQGDAARIIGVCGGDGDGGLLAALLLRVRVVCITRDGKVGIEREGVGEVGRRNIIAIQRDGAARIRLRRDRKLDVAVCDILFPDGKLDGARTAVVALALDGDGSRAGVFVVCVPRNGKVGIEHEGVDLHVLDGVGRRDVVIFQRDGAARVRLVGDSSKGDVRLPCCDALGEDMESRRRFARIVAFAGDGEGDARLGDVDALAFIRDVVVFPQNEVVDLHVLDGVGRRDVCIRQLDRAARVCLIRCDKGDVRLPCCDALGQDGEFRDVRHGGIRRHADDVLR